MHPKCIQMPILELSWLLPILTFDVWPRNSTPCRLTINMPRFLSTVQSVTCHREWRCWNLLALRVSIKIFVPVALNLLCKDILAAVLSRWFSSNSDEFILVYSQLKRALFDPGWTLWIFMEPQESVDLIKIMTLFWPLMPEWAHWDKCPHCKPVCQAPQMIQPAAALESKRPWVSSSRKVLALKSFTYVDTCGSFWIQFSTFQTLWEPIRSVYMPTIQLSDFSRLWQHAVGCWINSGHSQDFTHICHCPTDARWSENDDVL